MLAAFCILVHLYCLRNVNCTDVHITHAHQTLQSQNMLKEWNNQARINWNDQQALQEMLILSFVQAQEKVLMLGRTDYATDCWEKHIRSLRSVRLDETPVHVWFQLQPVDCQDDFCIRIAKYLEYQVEKRMDVNRRMYWTKIEWILDEFSTCLNYTLQKNH